MGLLIVTIFTQMCRSQQLYKVLAHLFGFINFTFR